MPLEIIEDLRKEKVKEGPEFSQVVLQWCACQQQLVVCWQQLQLPHQSTVEVFDPVAFIHNQVFPLEVLE